MLNRLTQLLPILVEHLDAKLGGVAGHTGHGEVAMRRWRNGRSTLDVEIWGVAGTKAEFRIGGECVAIIPLENGRADWSTRTARNEADFTFAAGDRVEVWQHGHIVLQGVLKVD